MKKIATILGARPQFIKAGTVSRAISENSRFQEEIIHTGQHFDANMSDIFFVEMDIPRPHRHLGINGSSHGKMTGEMISSIESVLMESKPDCVLLYGDTNSTLAGAIAASKMHIPIAHVEAGLRSFNMSMPEEINRIITDRVSELLFCPTETAVTNLKNEGILNSCGVLENVGDVMFDGALYYREKATAPVGLDNVSDFVLATIHRAENTDSPELLEQIVSQLNELSEQVEIILPLHPRTKSKLESYNFPLSERIKVIAPVGYLNMVWLIDNCKLVVTDSGGLQKEAYFFKKPCITMRPETEWVELVECGANKLFNPLVDNLNATYHQMLKFDDFSHLFYGNGDAAQRIVSKLEAFLNK
ncbi:UDP-N-acetylglucosamine 2-epimerase (non-hydrolyzing) [Pseudoalteromonas rubra]|uniref:UDP-N-acetylglucosamine 2-epimerase (Non-hydrolyzing) n=1 Tax=Pseudoalteromonas rubra TaxID=43658 RepID=A0A5S3WS13_9GAMM|nr:UDP-N-acetylglucosamine 2-epimerase (non-hydrolyzing) [Pseudoalteromonas rubra]TMP31444.1 UDP-N-acetylglucosamine 2-epimerase (non-hydrolyzing) [Pseudoalteromonas rubra]TMP34529.1 UDP-N-acetylglucosamine 2-epimerase (non-hydrolyzing) [Pseudoalteromonas rubra]